MTARSFDRSHPWPARRRSGDERACAAIASRHARTFSLAGRLLPRHKRRAAFAIYATCRLADDLVDQEGPYADGGRRALERFRAAALRALEAPSDDPILRELATAVSRFSISTSALTELFDGVALDLDHRQPADWPELARYCQAVAGSVGEMTAAVLGTDPPQPANAARVVYLARQLGVAMQLTNILRDIGEDANRGRCYLPADELADFGFGPSDVLNGTAIAGGTRWAAFMATQVARARALYAEAMPGIALLAPDAQACGRACAEGYARILDAVEAAGYDTFTRRVSASRLTLLRVAWRAWRGTAGPELDSADLGSPEPA